MMKKIWIKIMSLGLALSMIFGATGVSYAGSWNVKDLDVAGMLQAGLKVIEVTGPPTLPVPTVSEKPEPEPRKINIAMLTVTLDSYLVMATGADVTPKILSVSGEIEMPEKPDAAAEATSEPKAANETPTEAKAADETLSASAAEENALTPLELKPEEYEVKYYRVHSFSAGIYEEVKAIREIGEYKIAVTAKDTETYEGEAYSLFSVIGKPQKLTIAQTKYSLTVGDEAPLLQPKADGDGTGFRFTSSDETVLKVSENGQTEILKPGRALVTVATEETTLFQPAKIQVVFEISPKKVLWDTAKMKTQKAEATLIWKAQEGATEYEVVYCTEKSFVKPKQKPKESAAEYAKRTADYIYKSKTVKAPTLKTTLKGLKSDTAYYVKVRALTETTDSRGNKRTMEGPWSSVRKIMG